MVLNVTKPDRDVPLKVLQDLLVPSLETVFHIYKRPIDFFKDVKIKYIYWFKLKEKKMSYRFIRAASESLTDVIR